jgi:hypothetical protein
MRTVAVLVIAGLLGSLTAGAAEAQTRDIPDSLLQAATREAVRLSSLPGAGTSGQAQPTSEDARGWAERHPVWSGAILGAGVGGAWGVLSCSGSCFPIGRSGAAVFGAAWGSGIGALIGWAIGSAD